MLIQIQGFLKSKLIYHLLNCCMFLWKQVFLQKYQYGDENIKLGSQSPLWMILIKISLILFIKDLKMKILSHDITWLYLTVGIEWLIKIIGICSINERTNDLAKCRSSNKIVISITQAFLTLPDKIMFYISFQDCRSPPITKLWKTKEYID